MGRRLDEIMLIEMFIYIITGWIIIGLWQRFIENFFYNGLGLDRELPYHNFIVMFVITSIFLFIISFISQVLSEDAAGLENEQFTSHIVANDKSRQDKNGRKNNRRNDQSNLNFDQNQGIRQLSATVTSVESETAGRRGIPTITKSSYAGNSRLRSRSKDVAKNRLHRVDKILSRWDRDARDWRTITSRHQQ